ncbi:MAG TPA: ABC transporter substrate-binding protein [Roseburia sp.]|nr:ABC transporter substrate-binding protein [Roseburia sp.]
MKRKLVSLMLVVSMTAAMVAGCGSDDKKAADNNAAGTEKTDDKEAASGSVYYLNFKPEQDQQWQDLAKAYTDETGVPVEVVTAASGTYEETLKSEMAKSDAPTLFQVNGPVGLATWKDYCEDLSGTDLYSHVKSDDFVLKDGDEVKGIAYVIETYGLIYNKTVLNAYCGLDGAKVASIDEINSFDKLKEVADDIQSRLAEVSEAAGAEYDLKGAFTSAGMDSSSDWRFKTHLANLPIYYEYKADGIGSTDAIKGTYLDNYKQIWDLYTTDSTCEGSMLASKTGDDAVAEFGLGEAVFYQNGTWAYSDIINAGLLTDDDLGMMPIYIGADGEENQGLCTGSENYWCINSKASAEDIKATEDFLNWVVTSDKGRDAMANEMGFVTPFDTFDDGYQASNPFLDAANQYIADGKTSVTWCFTTMPSEAWKDGVGSALTAYAAGTGSWDDVVTAFVDGWASEYAAANE